MVPSRKWFAAQVIALGGLATSAIDSGWDATEWRLLVAVAVQAALTWLIPNVEPAPPAATLESGVSHVRPARTVPKRKSTRKS